MKSIFWHFVHADFSTWGGFDFLCLSKLLLVGRVGVFGGCGGDCGYGAGAAAVEDFVLLTVRLFTGECSVLPSSSSPWEADLVC